MVTDEVIISFFCSYLHIFSLYLFMNVFQKIWQFYYTGFKEMTVGKTLWIIILIKLFVMFFVLKLFFFKCDLREYKTEQEKGNKVIENILNT